MNKLNADSRNPSWKSKTWKCPPKTISINGTKPIRCIALISGGFQKYALVVAKTRRFLKKAWTCYFAFRQYQSWHDTATFEVVNLIIQSLHLFLIRLSNSRIVRWNLQNNIWKWPKNITNMKSLKTRFTQPRHVYFSKTSLMYLCTFRRTWK